MPKPSNLATRLYAAMLLLYPSGFREGFADEMRHVFAEAATEAQERGFLEIWKYGRART